MRENPSGDIAGQETETFDRLYRQYATDVLRVCYFYLGDRQKAEDVCQDVFVKLITTHPVLQPDKEKAWLLKVALNRCRDLWRSVWLKRVVLGSAAMERKSAPEMLNAAVERREMLEAIGDNGYPEALAVLREYHPAG